MSNAALSVLVEAERLVEFGACPGWKKTTGSLAFLEVFSALLGEVLTLAFFRCRRWSRGTMSVRITSGRRS